MKRRHRWRHGTCRPIALLVGLSACGGGGEDEAVDLDAQVALDAQVHGDAGDVGHDASDAAPVESDAGQKALSLDDVDLSLGGLNQDLPPPPGDCLSGSTWSKRCVAISGVYNGEAFQVTCSGDALDSSAVSPMYLRCRGPGPAGMVTVMVSLARDLVWRPPKLIQVHGESGSTRAYLTSGEQDFNSRSNSGTFVLEPTHALTFRLEGLTTSAPYGDHPYAYWDMRGAFAVSILPKPGCVPTAQAPCDAMRVRAVFFSLVFVQESDM